MCNCRPRYVAAGGMDIHMQMCKYRYVVEMQMRYVVVLVVYKFLISKCV